MKFPEKYTIETLRAHLNKIHPNLELLSTEYVDNDSAIFVKCKTHGDIWETTSHRLSQQKFACRKCYDDHRIKEIRKKKEIEFSDFLDKHYKGIYDFSKVKYVNNKTKITLICPEHGEFYIRPDKMIARLDGCPFCSESHLERDTRMILNDLNIEYQREKTFEWLKSKRNMFIDFFLPNYNIAIECQGEQHIDGRDESLMNKYDKFCDKVDRDKLKHKLCNDNGIKIIYIFNKINSNKILNEIFDGMYNSSLFIEDIIGNPSLLLEKINEQSD